ncbi:DUF1214 domain-containing protein [Pseudomonas corrugata]|jgi:hypothetical protein|uniref:DUF1214 domain-containing protein n=1 Tax=Pseudomonas corrugata TaxID=47879 RepID=UPI002869F426|nr:DUF1214 domain-containing protein [Pseudomonas corrugata]
MYPRLPRVTGYSRRSGTKLYLISLDLPVITHTHKKPQGENAANWLPAPEGGFYVMLRLYQPSEDVLSGKWQLPQLNKVN